MERGDGSNTDPSCMRTRAGGGDDEGEAKRLHSKKRETEKKKGKVTTIC
jgi:hypothetical protein